MSCSSRTLAGFDGRCETSRGGIKEMWLAPYAEGTFTITIGDDGAVGDVTAVATPTAFKHYTFRKGNSSLTSTLNIDDANGLNYVSTEVLLQLTKMQSASRLEINALALGGVMGLVVDNNGTVFAIGTETAVFASSGTGQSGTQTSDGNFYNVVMTDETNGFPPILTKAAYDAFIEAQE